MSVKDKNGNDCDLYFDTDCLEHLNTKWALGRKQVIISKSNVFFEHDENKSLIPLKNANIRGKCDWKEAY